MHYIWRSFPVMALAVQKVTILINLWQNCWIAVTHSNYFKL